MPTTLHCQQGTATRTAIVQVRPVVELGPPLATWQGGEVILPGRYQEGYVYSWSPAAMLNDATNVNPKTSPQETTRYTLRVRDGWGCEASDTITVGIYERIWIPDAFSRMATA